MDNGSSIFFIHELGLHMTTDFEGTNDNNWNKRVRVEKRDQQLLF